MGTIWPSMVGLLSKRNGSPMTATICSAKLSEIISADLGLGGQKGIFCADAAHLTIR